ncbi:MAG: transaldolase family protein [Anaerolineales bacterium]|nr:transaldolase family protein [Anaerolineales bacterium]
MTTYKSPLHQTVSTTATDFWNDSCSIEELTYAIDHGAVGATSNPTIVLAVIQQEIHLWRDRIAEIVAQNPTWSEVDVTWKVFEEIGVKGAEQLLPVFERESGKKGRLSIQTNPANYRTAEAIVAQALHFDSLAPNIQVKVPVTKDGLVAIEEATFHGVNINATVCFSVPQSIAVAEAVEGGLHRRAAAGQDISGMSPVCTIMVGRVDDWIQVMAKRDGIIVNPDYLVWPGVAVFKKAYQIFRERGYRARLLAAAYRHHLHWSEFIGGDVILTIPYPWQLRFNASDVEVKERMHIPVAPQIIDGLYSHFPDFRMAYDEDGLTADEFDSYGATVRTLRGFIKSFHDLQALIREEYMLPNPDIK